MKIKIFCFITGLMLILCGSVFAQNAQELRIGSSLSGNIAAGQEIWYGVAAAQDGLLVVQTTGDTDTFLEAYDAGGNFISENDDGPNEYNASLILSVKHGNNYFFRLTGYDESISGPYKISASYFALTQLNAGGSHSGNITDWDYKYFIFTAPRNGSLTIETSGSTDTYLCLYDENLEFLDYDDDGAEFPNDRIVHQVTSGKTYYIELGVYELGPYTISARLQ
ncbi:MAG: hypothetical protein LBG94_00120 [Treponema sp.]|nr:hypothetical protein [Treponema sp.]